MRYAEHTIQQATLLRSVILLKEKQMSPILTRNFRLPSSQCKGYNDTLCHVTNDHDERKICDFSFLFYGKLSPNHILQSARWINCCNLNDVLMNVFNSNRKEKQQLVQKQKNMNPKCSAESTGWRMKFTSENDHSRFTCFVFQFCSFVR